MTEVPVGKLAVPALGATLAEAINKKLADPDTKSFQCRQRKVAAAVLLSDQPTGSQNGRTLKETRA